jgi:hypothetical protein
MPRVLRAAALLVVAAALAAQTAAQPTAPPAYTAFPDLKAPTGPVEIESEKWAEFPDFENLHARLNAAAARPLPADATPAAKVRAFRLKSGADFLKRAHARRRVLPEDQPGGPAEITAMVNDVYRAAAGGEPDAVRRALAEERVRVLKELERQTERGVDVGRLPPEGLALIRFHRLGAEGDLLALTGGK